MMTYNEFAGYREQIESLRQQLAALQNEIARVKEVDFPRKVEAVAAGWKTKLATQREHSKEQFEKLLRWVDDYCEVSDADFTQIEPVVQSVLGEMLEETPLTSLRQQLADSQKQVVMLRAEIADLRRAGLEWHGKFITETAATELLREQVTLLRDAIDKAATQIKRCDYTPARSALLQALAATEPKP